MIIGLIVDTVIVARYKFVRRWVCPLGWAENKTLEPDLGWVWNDSSDLRWKTCVGKRQGDLIFSDRAQLLIPTQVAPPVLEQTNHERYFTE